MKNKKIFNIKGLKSFRSSLRNRSTLLRQNYGTLKNQKIVTPVNTINHPGRKLSLQYFNYNCAAATPPSKGGETLSLPHIYNTSLKLTAMGLGG